MRKLSLTKFKRKNILLVILRRAHNNFFAVVSLASFNQNMFIKNMRLKLKRYRTRSYFSSIIAKKIKLNFTEK